VIAFLEKHLLRVALFACLLASDGITSSLVDAGAAHPLPDARGANEIFVIDKGLADYELLLEQVPKTADTILIEPDVDGWRYLARAFRDRQDIDAIHVLGHGSVGNASLGRANISVESSGDYRDELALIGEALTAEGDILLYGCNVAADAAGVEFIDLIAELTGADISASDDLTGGGGDWQLEASSLSSNIRERAFRFADYNHNLVTFIEVQSSASQNGDTLNLFYYFKFSGARSGETVTVSLQYANIDGLIRNKSQTVFLDTLPGDNYSSVISVGPSDPEPPGDQDGSRTWSSTYIGSFGGNATSTYQYTFVSNTAPVYDNSSTQSLTSSVGGPAQDLSSYLSVTDTDSGQTLTWSQSSVPTQGGALDLPVEAKRVVDRFALAKVCACHRRQVLLLVGNLL